MKKSTFVLITILSSIFFFSYVSEIPMKSFVMTITGDSPELPEEPFTYSDIEFPHHLFPEDAVDPFDDPIGYGRGGAPDSLIFDSVTDHGATLGRVLFYDKKLSAVENISCGSCHIQELSFAENKDFSEGVNSNTKRNSMHLNDLLWTNADHFTWDMRQTDLHEMIILPLTDENEIGANMADVELKLSDTDYYPQLFTNAFGDSQITEERIVEALVQFITSMTTFESKFDAGVEKNFVNFTETETHGLELFGLHCSGCHHQGSHTVFGEPFPADIIFEVFPFIFNNGLPVDPDDKGAGEWNEELDNLFKVPTLRNIELTGPYMHDGRFLTLEEVVDHYSDEIVDNEWSNFFIPSGGFQFTDEEKTALVDFMKTLTDETFISNPRWSDPFENSLSTNPLEIETVALMPNPMSDRAIIKFSNPENKIASINIISQDGRLVKHDKITSNEYELVKGNFTTGVYFVQVMVGERKATQKLIVQ